MGLSQHKLLKGTVILSVTGFITRIIGFIYKIYLADLLGAHMLGLYQLVFPVYAICFTIYGAGLQTAISQVIAAQISKNKKAAHPERILAAGTLAGLVLAVTISLFVYFQADWIAVHFVMEPTLAPYLRILCFLFPFCSVSACINGYYYGVQEAKVPAFTQMVEQIVRVAFVFLLCTLLSSGLTPKQSCAYAVWGLVAGEIASNIYNVYHVSPLFSHKMPQKKRCRKDSSLAGVGKTLLWLTLTLTVTRLFVSLLNSIESFLLPAMLRSYGLSASEALSIYGVLTGMSLSFIFFPSTITHSFSVMLLPSIAEAYAAKDTNRIRHSVTISIKYCVLIGLLCTCLFLIFGRELGMIVFHNEDAGNYLTVLSWLCPFLYLSTTLTSVINGMEKTQVTFFFTVLSLGTKIAILVLAVPVFGIRAYLIGLLVSQLLLVFLECWYLREYIRLDALHIVIFPSLALAGMGWLAKESYAFLQSSFVGWYRMLPLAAVAGIVCLWFAAVLYLTGIVSPKDWRKMT